MSRKSVCVLAGVCLSVWGCVPETLKTGENRPTIAVPAFAEIEPIVLDRVVANIRRGTKVGTYYVAPLECGFVDNHDVTWGQGRVDISNREFADLFYERLTQADYKVAGEPNRLFEVAADRARARYLIGAEVAEVQLNLCRRTHWWDGRHLGYTGDGFMKVNWQVYSTRERRVVFQTATSANSKVTNPSEDGILIILQEAFAGAATNLTGDKGFHDLILERGAPGRVAAVETRAPAEPLEISRIAVSRGPIAARLNEVRTAAVSIPSAIGHGSGFFISSDGYILTNFHVVGEAQSINVRLLNGIEIPGRVVRRDAVRDVALVKIDIARARALPIRTEPVRLGEDIYAIGTPQELRLAGTVTRGIVSAVRNEDRGGVAINMIQSDVTIHGGNSGGPLIDGSGNVAGIAVEGIGPAGGFNAGLNFFIPIGSALDQLNLKLVGPEI